jgi:hypothetical protein
MVLRGVLPVVVSSVSNAALDPWPPVCEAAAPPAMSASSPREPGLRRYLISTISSFVLSTNATTSPRSFAGAPQFGAQAGLGGRLDIVNGPETFPCQS